MTIIHHKDLTDILVRDREEEVVLKVQSILMIIEIIEIIEITEITEEVETNAEVLQVQVHLLHRRRHSTQSIKHNKEDHSIQVISPLVMRFHHLHLRHRNNNNKC